MWPEIAAMAALTLLKMKQDQKNTNRQIQVQAATAKNSPWTGMQAENVAPSEGMNSLIQGAVQGYGMYNAGEERKQRDQILGDQKGMNERMMKIYERAYPAPPVSEARATIDAGGLPQLGSPGVAGQENLYSRLTNPNDPNSPDLLEDPRYTFYKQNLMRGRR